MSSCCLNLCLTVLSYLLLRFVVVSFAGDAIICVFMASDKESGELDISTCCQNAIKCAVEIKNYSSVDLTAHVAVSYGEICFAILGGHNNKWTYLINGDCLTELSDALNDAGSREAVATASCLNAANLRGEEFVVEAVCGKDTFKLNEATSSKNRKDDKISRETKSLKFSQLISFVPSPVSAAIAAGSFDVLSELRQVTTLFLKLESYSRTKHRDLLSLQPFYSGVQGFIDSSGGYMRQFLVDDKGCVVIALWGVPGTNHPNNCSRALYCGISISKFCETIEHQCSIGITTGEAYCGTVGSKIRQDYVAMGDTVNLSARLMCKAHGRVLIDDVTFSELPPKMCEIMNFGEALMLKGRTEPLRPYIYTGANLPQLVEADEEPEHTQFLVVNEIATLFNKEMSALVTVQNKVFGISSEGDDTVKESEALQYCSALYPYIRIILLAGPAGSGKGNAVGLFKHLTKKHNFHHVSFRLHQRDISIPYSAIHRLFLQLVGPTNFITQEGQRSVLDSLFYDCYDDSLESSYCKHFPTLKFVLNLDWDFEDVQAGTVARAFECAGDQTIQDILLCLLKRNATTVVIEDIHFCDQLSWKELLCLLDAKAPAVMLFTAAHAAEAQGKRRRRSHDEVALDHFNSFGPSDTDVSSKSSRKTLMSTNSQNFSQRSVQGSRTSTQTKESVYEGLSALDGFAGNINAQSLTAEVLLVKERLDYTGIICHDNGVYVKMSLLGEEEVADILKSVLGTDNISSELTTEVLSTSGGSIYWCQSIAKYIKVVGIDKFSQESMSAEEKEECGTSPQSVKSNFSRKLERHIVYHLESFSVKLQTIAKYASVIGAEFHLTVLYEILPSKVCVSLHDLEKRISTLAAEGIVDLIDEESNIYAFQNDLIRKKLMEYVLPSDADKIHRNIARAIEKLFEDQLSNHCASLSYHYAMSPSSDRHLAFKYTVEAADQQIGMGNSKAACLYLLYAATFVKYDAEMKILSSVALAAVFDLKQQKSSGNTSCTVTDEDIVGFQDMQEAFNEAVISGTFNGAKILPSASEDIEEKCTNKISSSEAKHVPLPRGVSAHHARTLKMPENAAAHPSVRAQKRRKLWKMCAIL